MSSRPVRLFISYAERDRDLLEQLTTHLSLLRRQGQIESWHERPLLASQPFQKGDEIDPKLELADIVLFLVTPSFMASDYCFEGEMKRAMELHRQGEVRVIPVIGRPVDMTGAPFSTLQGLPTAGKPITKWQDSDEAWLNVVQGLRQVVKVMQERPPRSAPPPSTPAADTRGIPEPTGAAAAQERPDHIRLYEQLANLGPVQFRKVMFYSQVPEAYLPAETASQADRAMELIRYFQRKGGLQALDSAIRQAMV